MFEHFSSDVSGGFERRSSVWITVLPHKSVTGCPQIQGWKLALLRGLVNKMILNCMLLHFRTPVWIGVKILERHVTSAMTRQGLFLWRSTTFLSPLLGRLLSLGGIQLFQNWFQVVLSANNSIFYHGIYNCCKNKTSAEYYIPNVSVRMSFISTLVQVIAPDFPLEFAGFFPREKSGKTREISGTSWEKSGK